MSYASAIATLSQPPPAVIVVRVTIPEGETRAQIARDRRRRRASTGSYLTASRRSPLLDPAHYGAPPGTPNLEGFLFPATYELHAGAPGEPAGRRAADGVPAELRRRRRSAARARWASPPTTC